MDATGMSVGRQQRMVVDGRRGGQLVVLLGSVLPKALRMFALVAIGNWILRDWQVRSDWRLCFGAARAHDWTTQKVLNGE
jgi:hypothetical protein